MQQLKKGKMQWQLLSSLQDQTESAAILKIKESMQEEAKRFEKDSDHPDFFMQ
jgi:hypothetical protein